MADAYGDNDLRRLEREAELARARLRHTLAQIKDPDTLENAKQELKDRADDMKEQVLGYIRGARDEVVETGLSRSNIFSRKLQRTAIENPLPVLLIGAGLGWHLYKKPPITAALLGAGVYGLMRNWDNKADEHAWRDPYNRTAPRGYVPGGVAGYGYDEVNDVASAAERVKTVATNLAYGAENVVSEVREAVDGAAQRVRETVTGSVGQMQQQMNAAERQGEHMAEEARKRLRSSKRGTPLFDEKTRDQLGLVVLMAGAGVLAGGLLRSSETGRRWMNEARESVSEGLDTLRDTTREWTGDETRQRSAQLSARTAELKERSADYVRSAQDMGAQHPLLLSAIGLAIGAVLGGMIRQTPAERARFASMASNLRERASDAVQENLGGMAERASNLAEAVVGAVTGDEQHEQAQKQRDRRVNA